MPKPIDAALLLAGYRDATGDEDVERLLVTILEEVARPIVRRVVASALTRDAARLRDAEDIVADTLMDLVRRLRDLREEGAMPIHDLRAYVATCAHNRCHEASRERYPARNRLRNQLQYLCGHHPALAVWRSTNGAIVCGLHEWQGRETATDAVAERVRLAARSDPGAENRTQLIALVPAVLSAAGAPLELNVLVTTVARLINLEQQPEKMALSGAEAATELTTDDVLILRTSLRVLWDDVRRLAPNQRTALLLNLRDSAGNECISLLPLTRTATMADIAVTLEMPLETLAALWNDLPLSDIRIAELLNLTARQVIKLRRLARERLRRFETNRRNQNLGRELRSALTDLTLIPRGRNR
jgi:DNA-directed RNA polymerase specialized sigma24 family protein